jgi:HK97 family phage prohead protease
MENNGAQRRYLSLEEGKLDVSEITRSGAEGEAPEKRLHVSGTPILYNRMTTLYENSDYVIREIIEAGAAREALNIPEQVLLWDHNSAQPMAARKNNTLLAREDDYGVHIDADVTGSVWGREGHEAIRSGLVSAMSFAFYIDRDGYTTERTVADKKEIVTRKIHKFSRIVDFSPVVYPAYKDTDVSARGADEILQEAEREKRGEVHAKIDSMLEEFREELWTN